MCIYFIWHLKKKCTNLKPTNYKNFHSRRRAFLAHFFNEIVLIFTPAPFRSITGSIQKVNVSKISQAFTKDELIHFFITFFCILCKKKVFESWKLLTSGHFLGCPKHDFTIFTKCLSVCLRVTQILGLRYSKN